VTLEGAAGGNISALLKALDKEQEATIVFTGSNADAYGVGIDAQIAGFCARNAGRAVHIASLGFRRYLSLLGEADVVVGNSSSGILEAPYMGVPTVNIGPRQQGRPRAPSVIDCENDPYVIARAIRKALSPAHKALAARRESPYGTPGAAKRMVVKIADVDLEGLLFKRFHTV
jgi:UDP-N-acetylglucosamine 2-epimerase